MYVFSCIKIHDTRYTIHDTRYTIHDTRRVLKVKLWLVYYFFSPFPLIYQVWSVCIEYRLYMLCRVQYFALLQAIVRIYDYRYTYWYCISCTVQYVYPTYSDIKNISTYCTVFVSFLLRPSHICKHFHPRLRQHLDKCLHEIKAWGPPQGGPGGHAPPPRFYSGGGASNKFGPPRF